jgi:predicted DNA-binding transcriptional regulator AlpA
MAQPTPPQRIRAKQIALENSIGESTVWNYAKQGLLTPIKITKGMTVFNRDEVEAFFNGERPKSVSR